MAVSNADIGVDASSEQGTAIKATSNNGRAVTALSSTGTAIIARNSVRGKAFEAYAEEGTAVYAKSVKTAIEAYSNAHIGVDAYGYGIAIRAASDTGKAVSAVSSTGPAIEAIAKEGTAVYAQSDKTAIEAHANIGVDAVSVQGIAIKAASNTGKAVSAVSSTGPAIEAIAMEGTAVYAQSDKTAIEAHSNAHIGVAASSEQGMAITAYSDKGTAVFAVSSTDIGVHGKGGKLAGYFEGTVMVTEDVLLQNADCAEDFEISQAEQVEPGTVMALNDEGKLEQSAQPYNKRVAGVVSGAGNLKPGLILGRQPGHAGRVPLALMGRVNCKVDAGYGSVEVGDLLTTSATPGHAMRADDPVKAFGAVIGKALKPLKVGQDLIPILVALQ